MHNYGDCSFCGGVVKEEKAELDYRYKGKLYVFQKVPVGVCQQCNEKYLTAEVVKKIERRILSKDKWDKTLTVPLDVFPEGVAV
jgi:YgiT-type zinc finger domain-containing protein